MERLGQSLRSHWGIENGLHWVLDVTFGEDGNRTRRGHGAENLSILRRIALGMLNQVKGKDNPQRQIPGRCRPGIPNNDTKKFLMR